MHKRLLYFSFFLIILQNPALAASRVVKNNACSYENTPEIVHMSNELALILSNADRNDTSLKNIIESILSNIFQPNGQLEILNTKYPGIKDAFREALVQPLKNEATRLLPLYRKDLAALYGKCLTASELHETINFFSSPSGVALLDTLANSATMSNVATDLTTQGAATQAALSKDKNAAGVTALFSLSSKDRQGVLQFFNSPAGKKVASLNGERTAIDIKWFNYVTPEGKKEVDQSLREALFKHIAKTDPDTAQALRAYEAQ